MKVKYVVDSTFYLDKEYISKYNIDVIPLNVIVDGKSYRDGIDIGCDQVLDYVNQGFKVSTSQPSPVLFEEAFERAKLEGYSDVVCMTMSSTLSGTYQASCLGAMDVEGINIHLIDTLTTSVGAELFAHIIIDEIESGKSKDEIIETVNRIKNNQVILMNMENLNALKVSGRINKIVSTLGNLLRVKPIIEYIHGKVNIMAKFKTDRAIGEFIVDYISKKIQGVKGQLYIYLGHIRAKERITRIGEVLKESFKNAKIKITDAITPVISVNLGYGGIGVAWTVA